MTDIETTAVGEDWIAGIIAVDPHARVSFDRFDLVAHSSLDGREIGRLANALGFARHDGRPMSGTTK